MQRNPEMYEICLLTVHVFDFFFFNEVAAMLECYFLSH